MHILHRIQIYLLVVIVAVAVRTKNSLKPYSLSFFSPIPSPSQFFKQNREEKHIFLYRLHLLFYVRTPLTGQWTRYLAK